MPKAYTYRVDGPLFTNGDSPVVEADETPEPNEFPVDALPIHLQRMAEAISDSFRVPLSMTGPGVIAITSGALGKGLKAKSGSDDRYVFPNIYILESAESGMGKTSIFKPATRPIVQFDSAQHDDWEKRICPSLKAEKRILEKEIATLEKAIGGKKDKDPRDREEIKEDLTGKIAALEDVHKKLIAPHIIVEDVTQEKLEELLADNNEQIFSMSSDAGNALQNLEGRYGDGKTPDDGILVKGRTGDRHTFDRIGRGSGVLKEPVLALFWMLQPEKLSRMLGNTELSTGGLMPRCLMVESGAEPTEIPENEKPIPPQVQQAYNDLIRSLLETYRCSSESRLIPDSEPATRLIREYHNKLVPLRAGDRRDINSFIARWHENAWGIALILHAAEHGTIAHKLAISEKTTHAAIEIMEWFSDQQLRLLSKMRNDQDAKKVESLIDVIKSRYGTQASVADLGRRNNWSAEELQRLVREFPNKIEILTPPVGPQGGRPGPIVNLKPK